jgi:NitT/TauT family transport system substrate-binding protein
MGIATLLGPYRNAHGAEPPPEIKRVRMIYSPAICGAPGFIAEEMLRAEGIEVEWVKHDQGNGARALAEGQADVTMWDAPSTVPVLDAGNAVVVLAGVHVGCWELFANDRVKTLRDLKGKTVAVWGSDSGDRVLLSSMLAYVGMDPRKDVKWITGTTATDPMGLFVDGKADAFMGFAPQPQELRAKKIGRVILNTAQDQPWSQYFCCMQMARRDFVRANPVATKRVLRAILKATDVCAQEPERVARLLADKGVEQRYEIGLDVVKSLPYNRWRTDNPENTLRFYALRLHEVGMIKSDPKQLIAGGTEWRFLNELKKELKA